MRQQGVSSTELIVVLAVLFLLIIAAGSGFGDVLVNWRLDSEINRLADAVAGARLRAITNQEYVTLCPLTQVDGHPTCMPAGRVTEGDWSGGWLVYVDNDRNGRFNPRRDGLLEHQSPVHESLKLVRTAFRSGAGRLTFSETGRLRGGRAGLFALCDMDAGEAVRALMVNLTGQVQRMDPARIEGFQCRSSD